MVQRNANESKEMLHLVAHFVVSADKNRAVNEAIY
jgi:hypothetical protein